MKKEVRETVFDICKSKHPEAILLIRIGDFYHAYRQDAKDIADVYKTSVTVDNEGDYSVFFFHTELDVVLPKLIRAGHRVAICDYKETEKQKA